MDAGQTKTIVNAIAEIVTATAGLNALLILELDRRGQLDKSEFSALLGAHIKDLADHPPKGQEGARYDLRLLEGVRGFLSGPPPRGWSPRVIEGGKD